jgi:hypothetical protein
MGYPAEVMSGFAVGSCLADNCELMGFAAHVVTHHRSTFPHTTPHMKLKYLAIANFWSHDILFQSLRTWVVDPILKWLPALKIKNVIGLRGD